MIDSALDLFLHLLITLIESRDPVKVSRPSLSTPNGHINGVSVTNEHLKRLEAEVSAQSQEASTYRQERDRATKGLEALTVIVQYLSKEYDAFSTPSLKAEVNRLCSRVTELKLCNDESVATISRLRDESAETLIQHQRERSLLEEEHRKTIEEKEESFKSGLEEASQKHQLELRDSQKQNEVSIEQLKQSHIDEIFKKETEWREELNKEHQKHQLEIDQLNERHKTELKESQDLWKAQENALEVASRKLQKEKDELVKKTKNLEETLLSDKDHRLQAARNVCKAMQNEVDSLKTVVEMRNSEVRKLRDQLSDKERISEELEWEKERVRAYKAKTEDLIAQMDNKCKIERHLIAEHNNLSQALQRESDSNKHLSLENEELTWKLRQREGSCPPELQFQKVKLAGKENSSSCSDIPQHIMMSSNNSQHWKINMHSSPRSNSLGVKSQFSPAIFGSAKERSYSDRTYETDSDAYSPIPETSLPDRPELSRHSRRHFDLSPPSSPRVKAVIEKSNSVSFILDLDDTFPEDPFLGLPSSPIFRNQKKHNRLEKSSSTSVLANDAFKGRMDRFISPNGTRLIKSKKNSKPFRNSMNRKSCDFDHRKENGEDVTMRNPAYINERKGSVESETYSKGNRTNSASESSDGEIDRVSPTGLAWTVPVHSKQRLFLRDVNENSRNRYHNKRESSRYSDYANNPHLLQLPDEDEYGEEIENEFVEVLELNRDMLNQDLNATPLSSLFSQTPTTSVSLSDCDLSRSESRVSFDENSEEEESTENDTSRAAVRTPVCNLHEGAGEGMVSPDVFTLKVDNVSPSDKGSTSPTDSNKNDTPNGDEINISWSEDADCDLTSSSEMQEFEAKV